MKSNQPPFIRVWILEHLTFGDRNDALSGDLLEEFRSDRSSGWYWRQVLAAVAASWLREARASLALVVFAALWIMLAQAWWRFALWTDVHCAQLIFPWPYSTVLGDAAAVFQFLWAGLVAYVLLHFRGGRIFTLVKVGRGFWIGPVVYIFLTGAIQIMSHPLGIPNASRGWLRLLTYFVSLVASAWGIRSRVVPEYTTPGLPGT